MDCGLRDPKRDRSDVMPMVRAWSAVMVALVLICLSGAQVRAEGWESIEFNLKAKLGTKDGQPRWVQAEDLEAERITIKPTADPELADAIVERINGQKGVNLGFYPGEIRSLLDPNGPQDEAKSPIQVSGFDNLPGNVAIGTKKTFPVAIVRKGAVKPADGVVVYLVSRNCSEKYGEVIQTGHSVGDDLLSKESWTVVDLENRFSLPAGTADKKIRESIRTWVVYARTDVAEFADKNGLGLKEAEDRLMRQYQGVALDYMNELIKAKMVPSPHGDAKATFEKATEIHGKLSGPLVGKSPIFARTVGDKFRFCFEGFGLTRAEILVENDAGAQGPLEERYLKIGSEGRRRRLLVDGTRLPTAGMMEADLEYLRKDPLIGNARRMDVLNKVCYICQTTPLAKRGMTVGFGAEYNADRSITAIAGLKVPARTDKESDFSFELSGGKSSISGNIDYLFPLKLPWTEPRWDSIQGMVHGGAEKLDDARYGNTLRDGVDATVQDFAVGAIMKFDSYGHIDRYEAGRPGYEGDRDRWFSTLEAGFRFRDTNLDGSALALTGLDEGARSGPYLDAQIHYGDYVDLYGQSLSQNMWWAEGRLALDTSFEALGGEADYLRLHAQFGGRKSWLLSDKLAGQASLGVSGGWASGGTPTFDYFGAGEEELFRGLRETEFIGRSYVAFHTGVGVDVGPLLKGVLGKEAVGATGMIFLFGPFADAGWLYDRVENGIARSGGRSIQSYGVQLEIMQVSVSNAPLAISVGYGWSPQSELDESGSFFSRMSLRF